MGVQLLDQYSLLHFSVGVMAYFWGMPFGVWVVIHTLFELLENTPTGITLINKFPLWPGGKPRADTHTNSLGDGLSAAAGWGVAALLDHTLKSPY